MNGTKNNRASKVNCKLIIFCYKHYKTNYNCNLCTHCCKYKKDEVFNMRRYNITNMNGEE